MVADGEHSSLDIEALKVSLWREKTTIFYWKHDDFPLKNDDFLLKNDDFLLKNDDFLSFRLKAEVGALAPMYMYVELQSKCHPVLEFSIETAGTM